MFARPKSWNPPFGFRLLPKFGFSRRSRRPPRFGFLRIYITWCSYSLGLPKIHLAYFAPLSPSRKDQIYDRWFQILFSPSCLGKWSNFTNSKYRTPLSLLKELTYFAEKSILGRWFSEVPKLGYVTSPEGTTFQWPHPYIFPEMVAFWHLDFSPGHLVPEWTLRPGNLMCTETNGNFREQVRDVGLSPLPATVANEGYGWDPLLKTIVIPVVTVSGTGDSPSDMFFFRLRTSKVEIVCHTGVFYTDRF